MNTITRFTKEQLIARADHQLCVGKAFIAEHPEYDGMAKDVELFKIALASLTAEPVGEVIEQQSGMMMDGLVISEKPTYRNIKGIHKMKVMPLGTKFYTAPPATTVTFYRDGIEAAAAWVDQQRESYDSEHGRHDPGTGTFEFGNDAQRDYSATLEEIAEGIRALHPNTAPPAPVTVPGLKPVGFLFMSDDGAVAYSPADWPMKGFNLIGQIYGDLNACRAAMLQGSQPVSNRDELPPGIKPAPELDFVAENAKSLPGNPPSKCSLRDGIEAIRNSGIPVDVDKIQSECAPGNSPVIPDCWIKCSDRMPEKGQKVFYYFDIVGVHAGYYDGDNTFVKENGGGWLTGDVTHWMEWILPAAPQQEVK